MPVQEPDTETLIEIAKPEVKIDSLTEEKLKEEILEEKQVIIHCSFDCPAGFPQLIRIWKTTFLIDKHSGHRSPLLYSENITLFPNWTPVDGGTTHTFTLVFGGLPSGCILFDFLEEIPQEGGFYIPSIPRNKTDVYHLKIS